MNLRFGLSLLPAALLGCGAPAIAQTPVPPRPSSSARAAGQAAPTATGSQAKGELEALIQVQPAYPEAALAQRLAGYVELKFSVNAEGRVQSATVTKSAPDAVFDAAAMAALGRWRYPAEPGREPVMLTHRFDFHPPVAGKASSPAARTNLGSAEKTGNANPAGAKGVRNACVHEGPVFDYGQLVQVGLESRCAEPLILFGCAAGTGQYQGRWVCTDSERQRHLLVPPGDARIGDTLSFATRNGASTLSYTDQFIISRAPNSEYWWLACGADDTECRGAARVWTRAVDGQIANVDPQGRTSLEVERSH